MSSRVLVALLLLSGFLPACDDECTTCPAPAGGIQGRVIDLMGNPVGGIRIVIGEQMTTTGPHGAFHFDDVLVPYDLVVLDSPVLVYRGLRRSDPAVMVHRVAAPLRFAIVTGRVPFDPAVSTTLFFAGALGNPVSASPQTSSYWMNLLWTGELAPHPGTLYALRQTEMQTRSKEYLGLATRPVTLDEGARVVEDFEVTDFVEVPTANVHATVTLPGAYESVWHGLTLTFEGQKLNMEHSQVEAGLEFDFTAPVLRNGSCRIAVGARDASLFGYSQGATEFLPGLDSSVEIVVFAGPELSSPTDGATDVAQSTPFAWNAGDGPGIYVMSVSSTTSATTLLVFTSETSTILTDVFGLVLEPEALYRWRVWKENELPHVDDAGPVNRWTGTGPTSWLAAPRQDGAFAYSQEFTFTTAVMTP